MIGDAAAEYIVYAGLAAGAAAAGWTGTWALAIAVIALTAVHQTMQACGRAGRAAGQRAGGQGGDDRPAPGSNEGGNSRHADLPRLLGRVPAALLSMPPGGRVLLIVVAAPGWGPRTALFSMLVWAIIVVGYAVSAPGPGRVRPAPPAPRATPPPRRAFMPPTNVMIIPAGSAARANAAGLTAPPCQPAGTPLSPATSAGPALDSDAALNSAAAPVSGAALGSDGPMPAGPRPDCTPSPGRAVAADPAAALIPGLSAAEPPGSEDSPPRPEPATSGPPADSRPDPAALAMIRRSRDDGSVARYLGHVVRGHIIPLPPALLGLAAGVMLAVLGLRDLPGVILLTPLVGLLVAAPGSSHPHDGRLDWLVPAVLQAGQYVYLAAVGYAASVPAGVTLALCAMTAIRYADLAAWPSQDRSPAGSMIGWEGRMLVAGLSAVIGVTTVIYVALSVYLGVLVCIDFVARARLPRRVGAAR
jgi:hypothetical protein